MPEYVMDGKENPAFKRLDTFTAAYVEAMFFADTPEGEEWSFHDLSESALRQIKEDCNDFRADQKTLDFIDGMDEQAGHDFWLTRQRHGAGFWDRGIGFYPEGGGKYLTERSKPYGTCWPYKGDDGQIYF